MVYSAGILIGNQNLTCVLFWCGVSHSKTAPENDQDGDLKTFNNVRQTEERVFGLFKTLKEEAMATPNKIPNVMQELEGRAAVIVIGVDNLRAPSPNEG